MMQPAVRTPQPLLTLGLAAAIVATTVLVYLQYGLDGMLRRDDAIYLYAGQRMAEGVPPYVSIFDHKGPLAPMLAGCGAFLAKALRADDILCVRLVFFGSGIAATLLMYLIARRLFDSQRAGVFAALIFLGFTEFTCSAASGPQAKTPMVPAQLLCLYMTSQRRWYWAGFGGALATLAWQPMAVFPLATLIIGLTQAGAARWKAIAWTVAGGATPVAAVVAYFAAHGAVDELVNGVLLFNLRYLDATNAEWDKRLWTPIAAVLDGYGAMAFAIVVGLAAFLAMYAWRRGEHASIFSTLRNDKFAPLLLTFPAPIAWSMIDFQWYADFYVFLPYAALGAAWMLELALSALTLVAAPGIVRRLPGLLTAALCVGIVTLAVADIHRLRGREPRLSDQRQAAEQIVASFGKDAKFATIGVPEVMVLLHRENPNRYLFIFRGIDRYIDASTPGGFAGWLRELDKQRPDAIAFGHTTGTHFAELDAWLTARYTVERFGGFVVLSRRPGN